MKYEPKHQKNKTLREKIEDAQKKGLGDRIIVGMIAAGFILGASFITALPEMERLQKERQKNIDLEGKPEYTYEQRIAASPSEEHFNYSYVNAPISGKVKTFSDIMYETYGKSISYTVQPNDNLSNICKSVGLDSSFIQDIADYNGLDNPDFIRTGDIINIPSPGLLIAMKLNDKQITGHNFHILKNGENLLEVAEKLYNGDAELAGPLAYMNKLQSPLLAKDGTVLYTPTEDQLRLYFIENNEQIQEYIQQVNTEVQSIRK